MKSPNKQKAKIQEETVLIVPLCALLYSMRCSAWKHGYVACHAPGNFQSFSITIYHILPPFPDLLGNAAVFREALHGPG